MSVGYAFGQKLGAYLKEQHRARCYQSFANILKKNLAIAEPLEKFIVAVLPVIIYNNAFSTPKTYAIVLTNGFYLDLSPTTVNENPLRVAAFNRNTIRALEIVQPNLWNKFNIISCDEYVNVTFLTANKSEVKLSLFSDVPGEKTLTMDGYETSRIYRFLNELKEKGQIEAK
jgi:hypothetical protein